MLHEANSAACSLSAALLSKSALTMPAKPLPPRFDGANLGRSACPAGLAALTAPPAHGCARTLCLVRPFTGLLLLAVDDDEALQQYPSPQLRCLRLKTLTGRHRRYQCASGALAGGTARRGVTQPAPPPRGTLR